MKKILLIIIPTALFALESTAGSLPNSLSRPHGSSQSLTFNDNGFGGGGANSGTYAPGDTIQFDIFLTYSGYNCPGFSFWLEVPNAIASTNAATAIVVTGFTYGTTFPDATQSTPTTVFFNTTVGASPGFMSETRNFGATINDFGNVPGPGTYLVGHITLTLGANMAPGNYILQSTVVSPHTSETTSFDGGTFPDMSLPATQYLIFVPEPSTFQLIGIGALIALGFVARRRLALFR